MFYILLISSLATHYFKPLNVFLIRALHKFWSQNMVVWILLLHLQLDVDSFSVRGYSLRAPLEWGYEQEVFTEAGP